MMTIGEISKQSGVKVPTIRYYESIGIVETPIRSQGNQRRYKKTDLDNLSFVRHARNLGFSLDDIQDLLKLSKTAARSCQEADQIAHTQLLAVQQKLKELRKLEKELKRISSGCKGEDIQSCYVIRALSDHDWCASEHHSTPRFPEKT